MAHAQTSDFKNPVVNWIDQRLPLFTMIQKEYGVFPTPRNFNYFWNFGAIAMVVLVVMIATGLVLAMHYTPHTSLAFDSVERIMRDVNYGWLLRYLHANGASMFFIAVYIHIFRGFLYGSYKQPRELLWIIGVVIFLLMMATAFMGYVLPWGQMSFWGATVITNLFSAVPLVGGDIVTLLWGGFSVDNPTLNRFFALHFLLPFVIFAVVFLHVAALHITGSNNPLGIEPKGPQDTLPFHPYYTSKDSFGLAIFLIIFAAFVFFAPNYLGHPDNYIPADPLVTPPHIVPEWYFLPFYGILRSITFSIGIPFTDIVLIPAKLGGVIAMFASILIWFAMPWLDKSPVRSYRFRPIYSQWIWMLPISFFMLMYAGGKPAEAPYVQIGQIGTVAYFAWFLGLPYITRHEKPLPLPSSIAEAVLGSDTAADGATAKPMEKA
ncbi:cytochrome b [Rhodocista pekingensis]|uniref:Cytochrome b n=1 Tax=Rhodocista pekingensis TaxID=201185 RepID=A0ABW2KUC5_9PROT